MIYKWNAGQINYVQLVQKKLYDQAVLILIVKVGSCKDERRFGISHYVEHMLVSKLRNYFIDNSIIFSATTYREHTSYEIRCNNNVKDIVNSISFLLDIYKGKYLTEKIIEQVRSDIIQEYSRIIITSKYKRFMILKGYDDNIGTAAIGSLEVIKSLKYKDIFDFHKENYSNQNCTIGIVTNLCISTQVKIAGNELRKIDLLPRKYVEDSRGFVFSENSKCEIYQRGKNCNNSYRARYIEDLSTAILETIFYEEFGINIVFNKAYFGKQDKYWIVSVRSNWKNFIRIIQGAIFLIKSLTNKEIEKYKAEYIETLSNFNLDLSFHASELINYLVNNIPVYNESVYKKMDSIVYDQEIEREILFRIFRYHENIIIK